MKAERAYEYLESPVGILKIGASTQGLTQVEFIAKQDQSSQQHSRANAYTTKAKIQLQEYFKGERQTFSVPLHFEGTEFQNQVWSSLLNIKYGQLCSYGEIAQTISNPKASRAVGMANNKNPIVIIIPCHRVIGSNGELTGYGGGLSNKEWLLKHEGAID